MDYSESNIAEIVRLFEAHPEMMDEDPHQMPFDWQCAYIIVTVRKHPDFGDYLKYYLDQANANPDVKPLDYQHWKEVHA